MLPQKKIINKPNFSDNFKIKKKKKKNHLDF
jgi:hypothetical protein